MIDGGLHQDSIQMKPGNITPTTIKNCCAKCGFSIDHVSSNYDSAVKLNEDERGCLAQFITSWSVV
jgi:hypothetical protein